MIHFTLDTTGMQGALKELSRSILPDVTARALNRTVEEAQTRARQELHLKFSIRTASTARFMENMIKITRDDRARPDRLEAGVRIEGPGNTPGRAAMLTRHIAGGVHVAKGGPLNSFFIPSDAARAGGAVPRSMYPRALRLMDRRTAEGVLHAQRRVTKSGKIQIVGKRRTFVLMRKGTTDPMGVYQREGPHEIQLLWFFTRKISLRPRFRFLEILARVYQERLPLNYQGFMDAEIRKRLSRYGV